MCVGVCVLVCVCWCVCVGVCVLVCVCWCVCVGVCALVCVGVRLSVKGYRLLQQQGLVNPPLECCEIVICWIAFISEGVPKAAREEKKLY